MTRTREKRRPGAPKDPAKFWDMKLYISGETVRSVLAIENLKRLCHEKLKGQCRITIIDVKKNPEAAFKEQIVVTPTLIRELPPPMRKIIGDLSETEKVLVGLDLLAHPAEKVAYGPQ